MRDLLRMARLALKLRGWVILGILLSLATMLVHIGLLALSSWFIASMAVAGVLGVVMEYAIPSAGVRALAIARAAGRYAERLVNHDTTFRILAELRIWFFRRVEPLAPSGLQRHRSGDLLSRIRADIDTLDDFYVRGVVPTCVAVLCAVCVAVFLIHFDARLALVDFAALGCAGVVMPLLAAGKARRPGHERVLRAAELRSCLVEQIQGMAELEALGAVELHAARVKAAEREMDRAQRALSSLQGAVEAQITAVSLAAVWASALILVSRVAAGKLPGPDMAMLTVVVLASFETIMPLPGVMQRFGEMAAAARRLFQIIDEKPAVTEAAPGKVPRPPRESVGLAIRDLHFRYGSDNPWVFRGLSLEAPPGRVLGISGQTGAGKSTLVSILLRFWEYEKGCIQVTEGRGAGSRETDLRTLGVEGARSLFSVVPQSPYLFHSSIRENLLIAKEGVAEEEMWSALQDAELADLVRRLPAGLDTIVGETGRRISVGEGQRLAVARALLRSAPVYILDEPTEGLDDSTAERLLDRLACRLAGRTVIIISHRPRDHRRADSVFRLAPAHQRS
jgi:ATP-binding cassette subfamily C protein CydC